MYKRKHRTNRETRSRVMRCSHVACWKNGMDIAEVVVACISDLAFNMSEYPAKDLELFSQHAGRKTVNMEDVILTGITPTLHFWRGFHSLNHQQEIDRRRR
ncbi:hypothetical protein ZOSMA_103G00870 [Zostera marina]|uniref:Centromere protein S n=1 Tax=Zostera marina TaxID=29655 RepID=A0A0K9Q525_ZOSMR|nr:hypothetical protein ZOSMA_103G00870 [Zostera marina]